ncbi:MAG: SAM-dependent methyltransferase [Acidobacteria bacterium]|nr:SAM-dependent methyltransferase [Acidobacteriota bacterium]
MRTSPSCKISRNLQKYETKNIILRKLISLFLIKLSNLIGSTEAINILDLGCGEGFVIKYLRDINSNLKFEGVDINVAAVDLAKKMNPGVNFQRNDINEVQYNVNSFDLVMLIEVLEHLEDPGVVLNEIKKFSNKYFVFSVPCEPFFSIANFLRGKNILRWGNDPEHLHKWSRNQFVAFVGKYYSVLKVVCPFPWIIVLCRK